MKEEIKQLYTRMQEQIQEGMQCCVRLCHSRKIIPIRWVHTYHSMVFWKEKLHKEKHHILSGMVTPEEAYQYVTISNQLEYCNRELRKEEMDET